MSENGYLEKLCEAYQNNGLKKQWEHLMNIATGISAEDKATLLAEYPDCPPELLSILDRIDGTYYRNYNGTEVACFIFASDVEDGEYPYYLLSAKQILSDKDCGRYFDDLVNDAFHEPKNANYKWYGPFCDSRITAEHKKRRFLHFADCMNNGGTSSLYIDFSPAESGVKGQIVRFLHDPDELKVIANSFRELLAMIVEQGFAFIQPTDAESIVIHTYHD